MIPIGSIAAGVNVLSGLLTPLAKPSQPEQPVEPAGGGPLKAPKLHPQPPPGATAALRSVLARYDVTNTSPRQFSAMLEELHKTGAMSDEELNQLGLILLDLDAEHVALDESLDLVKFYSEKLDKLQEQLDDGGAGEKGTSGVASSLAAVQSRLNWLRKFALMHSAPDAVGMNVLT